MGGPGIRQRHNERENTGYVNNAIIKDRAAYNVQYKQTQGSFERMFK